MPFFYFPNFKKHPKQISTYFLLSLPKTIELERRRLYLREGLKVIRKEDEERVARAAAAASTVREPEPLVWMARPGGFFMRSDATCAKAILSRG